MTCHLLDAARALIVCTLLAVVPMACAPDTTTPSSSVPRPGVPARDATLSAPCAAAAEPLRTIVVEHASSLDLDTDTSNDLTAALEGIREHCSPDEQARLLDDELGAWLAGP
jgi:hypothetical protein